MMQHFDRDYADRLLARLAAIPEDAKPRWGRMNRTELIEHLIWAMKQAMGRSRQVPDRSNWVSRNVLAPLAVHGWMRIPRNVRFAPNQEEMGITLREQGDLETLQALLEEYLSLVQADELRPAPHPFFGDIGVDGWDRLHVRHFEHHLRQFNA